MILLLKIMLGLWRIMQTFAKIFYCSLSQTLIKNKIANINSVCFYTYTPGWMFNISINIVNYTKENLCFFLVESDEVEMRGNGAFCLCKPLGSQVYQVCSQKTEILL